MEINLEIPTIMFESKEIKYLIFHICLYQIMFDARMCLIT